MSESRRQDKGSTVCVNLSLDSIYSSNAQRNIKLRIEKIKFMNNFLGHESINITKYITHIHASSAHVTVHTQI